MADCPTAIYCANDMVALGVINEARRLGIQVPKELSVCGFDYGVKYFKKKTNHKKRILQILRNFFLNFCK